MNQKSKHVLFAFGVIIPLVFMIFFVNREYPFIAGDYGYFLARFIDVIAHYKNNGLSIQWFTPSFGGGLPAYSNPQHTQFFLPQLLSMIVNPWLAIMISIAVFITIGYFFCYKFISKNLDYDWETAIIGSIFFISNGFYIQRIAAGHITFLPYPLIMLAFYLVFSKKASLFHGISFGVVIAGILFSGGVHVLIIFVLAYIIMVPLLLILYPSKFELKGIFINSLVGLLVSLLLSSGKIFAVYSFVRHFSRDYFYSQLPTGFEYHLAAVIGLIFQFIAVPSFFLLNFYRDYYTHFCEIDVSIIYPQIFFLYTGMREIIIKATRVIKYNPRKLKEKGYLIGFFLIAIWFVFEFTVGRGVLFELTRKLPIINMITVRSRYAAAFLFPFLVFCLNPIKKFINKKPTSAEKRFAIIFLLSLLSLFVYFFLPKNLSPRTLNVNNALDSYDQVIGSKNLQITTIGKVDDISGIPKGISSIRPYEAVFGYGLETFKAETVEGPITLDDGGFFNMTNPFHLVYSENNLFQRFSTDEYQMMKRFASYQQPDWNIPTVQIILNLTGIFTFIIIVFYFFLYLAKWYMYRIRSG